MGGFPTTHWSNVHQAAATRMPAARDCLGELLQRYAPALRAHLRLTRRIPPGEVDDLLQGFITSKILEKGILGLADRQRGRFRTFLMTALDRFIIDCWRARRSRGQCADQTELTTALADLPDDCPGPTNHFDLVWARSVLEETLSRTREYFNSIGSDDLWRALESRVLIPIFEGVPPPPYEQFVEEFGYATATQACSAVVTARRALSRILREIVGQYTVDEEQTDEEIITLRRILCGAP